MLHICLRVPGQSFAEPPFEEEILAFICFLGHSAVIRTLTDVKHKDHKKSNEMYCPRFTKVIIHYFMSKDPSIPRRNKVNWHYVRDDHMFSTIKLVSRHQNIQQFGTLLPIDLTNEEIRNSNAYKEYYAVATGAAPPKKRLVSGGLEVTHISQASGSGADEGTGDDDKDDQEVVRDDDKDDEKDDKEEGEDDEQEYDEETRDEESFDPIPKTPENSNDEGNGEEDLGLNVGREEGHDEEEEWSVAEFISFAGAASAIPGIVQRYMDQRMSEAVQVAIQLQSDKLSEEAQKENDEFLKTIDENMQNIIKEQVKEQVKVQVSKILTRIEQTVNEQLEAKVHTRSSHSSNTSYTIDADLSEMELKKILIEKIEGNKSIQRSDEQRNLYKALVEVYESDKIILDTYGETVTLKRCRDDDVDKDEEPFVGPDRGSKRRREGKEPKSASALTETATRSKPPSPDRNWNKTVPATHGSIQVWITKLAKQSDSRSSFNELMDTPLDFSNFLINWIKTKVADYKHIKWIEDLVPRTIWIAEPIGYDKHAFWGVSHWGRKRQQFYGFAVNRESARDVDDDKLYKFKEGDFKRLRIQDIEDMLLLLVQRKLTNLTVKECFAFNVSLRMFTRSIVIQRSVEDLQPGVESYQKKLNLTKLDSYRSDLKCKEAYTAYSNPRGFIYQNKDKKNRLMRIDELHKFSDGTLIDVRTALDDRLKEAKNKEDHEELREVCWRKAVRGRLQDATKDDMIYRMLLLSFKRNKSEYMEIVPTEMELILEHTQQGISHEVSVTPTKPGRITKPYSSYRFIANCFNAGNLKMEVKGEIVRYKKSIDHSIEISLSSQKANWAIGRPKAMMGSILAHLVRLKSGSKSRPPMLNKENYVPWSSRLLRYAKSRPNEKLIHNSILNGPYVRRMIPEPGDGERDVNVNETRYLFPAEPQFITTCSYPTNKIFATLMYSNRKVTPTKPGRMTKPYSSHRFFANCFNAGNLKIEVKNFKKDESESYQDIQSRKSNSKSLAQDYAMPTKEKEINMVKEEMKEVDDFVQNIISPMMRVSQLHILDAQTLFIFNNSALTEKSPEGILEDEIS
nr:ribonuclease H-like domain-containing protein [Tanacetum cinerariifolium]